MIFIPPPKEIVHVALEVTPPPPPPRDPSGEGVMTWLLIGPNINGTLKWDYSHNHWKLIGPISQSINDDPALPYFSFRYSKRMMIHVSENESESEKIGWLKPVDACAYIYTCYIY